MESALGKGTKMHLLVPLAEKDRENAKEILAEEVV